jgi:hypothetical protein
MNKAATLLIVGLLALLIINGARLTFFPDKTCHLARGNIMPPLSQSVMEFHREQEKRNVPK